MPRPIPPANAPLKQINLRPIEFPPDTKKHLATALNLETLPTDAEQVIRELIACHHLIDSQDANDCTIANVIAALSLDPDRIIQTLMNTHCGLDEETCLRLRPLAIVPGAATDSKFLNAVEERLRELKRHPRVSTETESFRYFCGYIREIFKYYNKFNSSELWSLCAHFADEIFELARLNGITVSDFSSHRDRLKEYLGTDISALT